MDNEAKRNKRLGIKVPRSILLPPYLYANSLWVEFADSVDEVFGATVDSKIDAISKIRQMWVQNPDTELSVLDGSLIDNSKWTVPERDLVVKQVNMLGMRLRNAGIVSDDAYQTIARFVGEYWFGKGTQAFADFMSFCLSTDLRVINLWTQDYDTFYREGAVEIGDPVWDAGTWYPTTHVEVIAGGGLGGLDFTTLQSFFYEIANYNLVLQSITSEFNLHIVDAVDDKHTNAAIIGLGLWYDANMVIANFKGFGSAPPPSHYIGVLGTDFQLPTSYYAPVGDPNIPDVGTHYLLAKPSGWMKVDNDTKTVPVYGEGYQTPTIGTSLGVELIGSGVEGDQFNLLYGPITWATIPGSPTSKARIPVYSTGTFDIQVQDTALSTKTIGTQRTGLLVNPDGFYEIYPGEFTPYWIVN